MRFNIGKVIGGVLGFGVAGPLGGAVGSAVGGMFGGKKQRPEPQAPQQNNQRESYERQLAQVRGEQTRMNERLETSRNAVNAGIARSNRSRARGGIFGDAGNQGQISPRLG